MFYFTTALKGNTFMSCRSYAPHPLPFYTFTVYLLEWCKIDFENMLMEKNYKSNLYDVSMPYGSFKSSVHSVPRLRIYETVNLNVVYLTFTEHHSYGHYLYLTTKFLIIAF